MELSKIETIALLVPNKEETVTGTSLTKSQTQDGWRLSLKVGDKQHSWEVSQCVRANSQIGLIEKYKELINLAMNGYNAAGIYISIGSTYLYENRRQSHETILNLLKEAIASSKNPIQIEYVYMCVTDDNCFDCRKDKWRSTFSVYEGGIDSFMKGVSSIDDIWKKVQTGSKLPFILKIMLYDQTTKRRGNLFIIDLLHPKFFAHTSSSIHYSFISLRDAIDTITMPNRRGKVPLEPHLLVNILAEFISGRSKSTVFTYINEYPQKDFDDVIAILDLIKSLTNIPCISLPNETNPRATRETEDMKNQTERLNKTIDDIQAKNTALSEKYSTFMNAFRHFKELKRTQVCQEDLVHKLNAGTIEDSIRRAKIELFRSEAIANIKDQQKQELEHEVKKLKLEIANNTKMMEEYGMTTKNHQEQLERCKEEIQRLRKAAMQSQKEISILHREHEAEKQKLIDNFKQKAAEFKEGVRRRFEEMQNS